MQAYQLEELCSGQNLCLCEFTLHTLIPAANAYVRESFNRYTAGEYEADNNNVAHEINLNCEVMLKDLINAQYPDHSVLGDVMGYEGDNVEQVWVIKGVDGKPEFNDKLPGFFSTTITYIEKGKPIIGLISDPLGHKLWVGEERKDSVHPFFVPRKRAETIEESVISTTSAQYFDTNQYRSGIKKLFESVKFVHERGNANAFGHVSCGAIDIALDNQLKFVHFAPLIPVLKSSSAVIKDLDGNNIEDITFDLSSDIDKKFSIITGFNEKLVDQALEILKG